MTKTQKAILTVVIVAVVAAIGAVFVVKSMGDEYSRATSNVKLGKYKGLEYELEEVKVTQKDVDERVQSDLQGAATAKDVDKGGKVEKGYTVDITYKGRVDGKKFGGSDGANYVATAGQSGLPFDEYLEGMEVGSKKTVEVKLPKGYQDSTVEGKKATYEITVNSATKYDAPEYDDKFVKEKGYKSKKEYEDALLEEITKSREDMAVQNAKQTLLAQAIANAEIKKVPEKLVDEEYDKVLKQYKNMAKQYNVSWEDFLKTYVKSDEKELKKNLKTSAETTVRDKLVIAAIAKKENISASGKDYDKYTKKILNDAGLTEKTFKEQFKQTYKEYCEENDFPSQYLREKVSDLIFEAGKKA